METDINMYIINGNVLINKATAISKFSDSSSEISSSIIYRAKNHIIGKTITWRDLSV
mgnify:CR=1 FL=1